MHFATDGRSGEVLNVLSKVAQSPKFHAIDSSHSLSVTLAPPALAFNLLSMSNASMSVSQMHFTVSTFFWTCFWVSAQQCLHVIQPGTVELHTCKILKLSRCRVAQCWMLAKGIILPLVELSCRNFRKAHVPKERVTSSKILDYGCSQEALQHLSKHLAWKRRPPALPASTRNPKSEMSSKGVTVTGTKPQTKNQT